MAPFFSYRTFASVSAAVGEAAPTDADVTASAAVADTISNSPAWRERAVGGAPAVSHEGANAGDCLADDQILHLIGALVGVERLGVGKEARHVVVGDNAVAAEEFAAPGDRLARLGG